MRQLTCALVIVAGMAGPMMLAGPAREAEAEVAPCAPDAAPVGATCVDRYETSVWFVPSTHRGLIKKIRDGRVSLSDLTSGAAVAAGVVQRGALADDYGAGCPADGKGCVDLYAVSVPGVTPSRFMTWFQAAAVTRNSRKRLLTNAEWQTAALGTPDLSLALSGPADCNVNPGAGALPTGGRANCVSDAGMFDMVGNLWEWVADWVPQSTNCVPALGAGVEPGGSSGDINCFAGASTTSGPTALLRGGGFTLGIGTGTAGVYAVDGSQGTLSLVHPAVGVRAAR